MKTIRRFIRLIGIVVAMPDIRRLVVWQKANALSRRIDEVVRRIARAKPRLADQMDRSAESVGACIAEGRGRNTDKDFANFVSMAVGSVTELENHLQRALDLSLIEEHEHRSLADDAIEVRKMLIGLRKRLQGFG